MVDVRREIDQFTHVNPASVKAWLARHYREDCVSVNNTKLLARNEFVFPLSQSIINRESGSVEHESAIQYHLHQSHLQNSLFKVLQSLQSSPLPSSLGIFCSQTYGGGGGNNTILHI